MDECVLEAYLKCITNGYNVSYNVIAIDEINSITNTVFPRILVVNTFTRNSVKRLGHWVVFFMKRTRKSGISIEFYDSLNCSPDYYGMKLPFHVSWKARYQTQGNSSENCGKFVCLYVYYRLRKVAPTKIVQCIFNIENYGDNESRVIRFGRRIQRQCKDINSDASTLCASKGYLIRQHFNHHQSE